MPAALVAEMARVAQRRVIVLDIRRHWLAYWGFVAWSRLWTRNRLVRFDGPLSVLRGFTPAELMRGDDLPDFEWTIRSYAGFQLALVGRRRATPRGNPATRLHPGRPSHHNAGTDGPGLIDLIEGGSLDEASPRRRRVSSGWLRTRA